MPVLYSPVMTSTPSTATTSCARKTPNVEDWTRRPACAAAPPPRAPEAISSPLTTVRVSARASPSMTTTTERYDQTVDRSVRSLIHSERSTPPKLSEVAGECGATRGAVGVMVVIGVPPYGIRRRRR
ncbi:hypothetical protein ASG80_18415 [Agromyces sp. Soil535]|nr:hypothetical protein ASG80_18415 [Agromyces sp. Soil535]